MQISGAEYVIEQLGGLTKVAKALAEKSADGKFPVTTVQGWKERKKIPQEHWHNLLAVAEDVGVALTFEDFLKSHEKTEEAA